MKRKIVSASLSLIPTEAGGRSAPVFSGYRSLVRLEGDSVDFGFELTLDATAGSEEIMPGCVGSGRLSFWAVEDLPLLTKGQRFEIREGTRIIGSGEIIEPNPEP
jgi:translation elongation factor EF-Tu-like GTPase